MTDTPTVLAILASLVLASACATQDPGAIPMRYTQATANAAYTANYNGAGSYSPGAYGYSGPYWSPRTFASYSGWPAAYSYGETIGENQCRQDGSLYTCDTDGDGRADIYGDSRTGAYAAPALRVNAKGKAFAWRDDCTCWQRAPGLDGPRKPGNLVRPDQKS